MLLKINTDMKYKDVIREFVFAVLHTYNGNRTLAAASMDVDIKTLKNWINKWQEEGYGKPDYGDRVHLNERYLPKKHEKIDLKSNRRTSRDRKAQN